ncbi:MAG: nucleoside deaminase [Desulfobacterales bacterium]|nr:nucleoside deaminase [Desulfobacterales bacterium]MDD4072871.1 nucleoside deaminase [Desulfobacterales bacterium]MDD4392829.1 nucleoside deaminase [Desulfobacterales bacterium]
MKNSFCLRSVLFLLLLICVLSQAPLADASVVIPGLDDIQARIDAFKPDPEHKDDIYGLIAVRDAITSLREGSGGIGACLINEKTGEVIARGRNRQYVPYFRSDLHAEMDLLDRYEDWMRKKGGSDSAENPRNCENLVLISSVEPCPMCLTRIINSGIKKMYYITPDESGGMVSRIDKLPPFWKDRAENCDYRPAQCSPEIQQIARDLFDYSMRVWAKKKAEKKFGVGPQ